MLKLLLGDPNARKLKRYQPIVSDIQLLEEEIARSPTMSYAAKPLPSRSDWPMPAAWRISGRSLTRSCRGFHVVREAGKRVLGMRHFDVQLIGGMVLHEGQIAKMKTGEGKPGGHPPELLNALTGKALCGDGERLPGAS